MKSLINGESLKKLNSLNSEFTASITARLNASGVLLDDVLWVYDTLRSRSNYAHYSKDYTVRQLARLNKVPVTMRLAALQNVLSDLWHDYAHGYNSILAHGVLCSTQGAWDVFKNLRKKLRSGKPFAFTVSNFRLESVSPLYPRDILLKYGKNFDKSLRFIPCGDSYRVDASSHVSYPLWLNQSTGKVEYRKDGLLQDVFSILQAPVWETEELPTHLCFQMLPTAFITSVLGLHLETMPDELGVDELFEMCRRARGLANGNA